MFGKPRKNDADSLTDQQIKELRAQLEEKTKQLALKERVIDSVNTSTHLGLWESYYDEKGNQTTAMFTPEFRKMLGGYTNTELSDDIQSFAGLIHPDDTDLAFSSFAAAAADKTNRTKYNVDFRLKMKNGDWHWFHAAGDCIRKPDGTPIQFVGTFTDIHDAKLNAEKLAMAQRRQEAVDRMLLEGSWSLDLEHYQADDPNAPMVFSSQFKKILGYDGYASDFPDIMESFFTRMHPDDIPGTQEGLGGALSNPNAPATFEMEYRMRHRNGNYLWMHTVNTVTWSSNKRKPLMLAGTILDVTDQKNNKSRFKEEMAPSISKLQDGIQEIAKTVQSSTKQMQDMADRQLDVAESAKKIEASVESSMGIITSIQSIANRTNLLSLNASIEAARAGEAGKGFAVVAGEVQNLSNSTKSTTNQIAEILNGMNESIADMLSKLTQISDEVTAESAQMQQIDSSITELHNSADEIARMANSLYT